MFEIGLSYFFLHLYSIGSLVQSVRDNEFVFLYFRKRVLGEVSVYVV